MGGEPIYCRLAYNGFALRHNGSPSPCCQWKFHDVKSLPTIQWWETDRYTKEIRSKIINDLKNGIKHIGCNQCWEDESSGLKSYRQISNEIYSHQKEIEDFKVLDLELNLGTLCNLRCIMCGPYASSLWETEYKLNTEKSKFWHFTFDKKSWVDDPKFFEWLTPFLSTVNRINFSGGEPFIIPQFETIIKNIISINREKDIKITMNTNLTKLSKTLLNNLNKFKKVNIMISLEGIGTKNNYLRFPSKWEEIEKNINLLFEYSNFEVAIHHTIQHSSVYTLPELIDFFHSKNFHYFHTNTVQGKLQLELEGVPKKDMDNFTKWAKLNESIPVIKNLIPRLESVQFNLEIHKKFRQYIDYIDSINETDWDSTFCPSSID